MIILIVIAGIFLLFIIYAISAYNLLVKLKNLCQEAWSSVDVFLKKRYDLIPNLMETVKGYAAHESSTFEKVTQARTQAIQAKGVAQQQSAEAGLNRALGGLFAVVEQYPDLKANQNFMDLQAQLNNLESDIEKSRRYYNGCVRQNNIAIESFPSNIFAGLFGFKKQEFFELPNEAERELPKVKF